MCSLNADEGGCEDFFEGEQSSLSELAACRSCINKAVVVLRKKDSYCRECFLANETHKFRSALGKTKMMKPHDKVLVAYSGSQSSVALLHLLQSGVSEKHHKKLLFNVHVLFIDEGAIYGMSHEDRLDLVNRIKESVKVFDFPISIISLSECLSDNPKLENFVQIDPEKDSGLRKLFESFKSVTSKDDLLSLLRKNLIQKVAIKLKCNKIFTAEVGNDLAVKLLSDFSLGRGDATPFEAGFCDARNSNFIILRPLRDFLKKEIVFYNKFHNLTSINTPTFSWKSNTNVSIQKLTEKFINDLQVDFPSTVYTIFRTGEKLSMNKNVSVENVNECIICQNKCGTNTGTDYTALDALNLSKNLSNMVKKNCGDENDCCSSNSCSKGINSYKTSIEKNVCYGCNEIVNDLNDINCLPKELVTSVIERNQLKEMENQISEFLIKDS